MCFSMAELNYVIEMADKALFRFADRVWEAARERFYNEVLLANNKSMLVMPKLSLAEHIYPSSLLVKQTEVFIR